MTFEPDTNDIRVKQLQEQIDELRSQIFVKAFSTNSGTPLSPFGGNTGIAPPGQGQTADLPQVFPVTLDTGVIDKLDYVSQFPNSPFTIGEVITGASSGATATIGDIDITVVDVSGTLTLVPSSITGTFTNNEIIDGDITGRARVDGTQFTSTGRGHLIAGATSIEAQGSTTNFELHFIDESFTDGQKVMIRPTTGQTMTIRRPTTSDGTTGNIDVAETVTVTDQQIFFAQFRVASNVTPDGGWVPVTSALVTGAGAGVGDVTLPIIYDVDDKGDLDGTVSSNIDLSLPTGNTTEARLIGGSPIAQTFTISGSPPDNDAILFFLKITQDSNGGHSIIMPASVSPAPVPDPTPNTATVFGFITYDNGTTFQSFTFGTAGAGDNLGNHVATQDLNMSTFDIFNADKILFTSAGGFNFPVDATLKGFSTSGSGLEVNIPAFQEYRFFIGGIQELGIEVGSVDFFNSTLEQVGGILFTVFGSISHTIIPLATHLEYNAGIGTVHQFKINNGSALLEINDTEVDGGVKLFTDLNLQTQNINNVDKIKFVSNNGLSGGNQFAIAGDVAGNSLQFNVPLTKEFNWRFNDEAGTRLVDGLFQMLPTLSNSDPRIQANQLELLTHTLGTGGQVDGMFRLVNTGSQNDVIIGSGGSLINLSTLSAGTTSFIGFTADDDLDMGTFNIFNLDVLRFVVNGGVIGFNTYGISADSGDFSMNFSVPSGRDYIFQNNLDPIAVIDETGIQVLSNTAFTDPIMIAREFTAIAHSLGTSGLGDGSWRLVGGDVIFGSGGGLVNLTTLSAGGGDNLGDHTATQSLNMSNFGITNFVGWTGGVGDAFTINPGNFQWDQNLLTEFYRWRLAGITQMELSQTDLNMFTKQITNVVNPLNPQDVATKDYVDGVAGGTGLLSSNNVWTGTNTYNGSTFTVNSGAIFLGNQTSDQILITARFAGNLIPASDNTSNIGQPGLEWRDLHIDGTAFIDSVSMGGNINMNFNRIFNVPTVPALANDATSKAYVDSVSGGGLLASNNTWTGTNSFFADVSFGNSTSDRVNFFARVATDIVPRVNNSEDLGISSNRWRDLFIDGSIRIRTGSIVLEDASSQISMSGGPISGVGLFANTGSFFHGGSTLGFFGKTPLSTKLTALLANFTTAGNANAINTLIGIFQNYGLVN